VASPLDHLGIEVLANVGSLHQRVPSSAEGIGLLRTELLFSDRESAPSEAEQFGTLCAITAAAPRSRVVVRLFDAGDDKPLPWLQATTDSPRGIALLAHHPEVLDTQLRAIKRASGHGDLRVLVPYVERASEVLDVRARLRAALPVGAQIETRAGVERLDEIARVSDFISIGTNDLAASVAGDDRANAGLPFDPRVLDLVTQIIDAARRHRRVLTVCGEMAGDAHGARILVGLGVHALSVAPARIAPVKLSLRQTTLDDCRAIARVAATGAK
jgi:phosphoenolpyruvate-protein kinase (PTS system EI component)